MAYIPQNVVAELPFVYRSDLYKTVKPYGIDLSTDKIPRSNLKTHRVGGINITDIRDVKDNFDFYTHGFQIFPFQTSLEYPEWSNKTKVEDTYCVELGAMLLEHFDASAVQVFEAQVRRRHSSFPDSNVDVKLGFQPAMRPHVDASFEHARSKIMTLNGDGAEDLMNRRWIYLNVWKPLRGPLRDWPLAICDPSTVQPEIDLINIDNIIKGEYAENIGMHFSEQQRWYYLGNQGADELLVFRQMDSDANTGVPHASFRLPVPEDETVMPRESIEVRIFVYF